MSTDVATLEKGAVLTASDIRAQVNLIQEVMKAVMKGPSKEHPSGVHYGIIPGTPKPTLYKPGAEVLCATFRIAPEFAIEDLSTEDCYRYRVTCRGVHQTSGITLASGLGSASSNEEKYRWRAQVCDEEFAATPENRKRTKYKKGQNGFYTVKQVRAEPADIDNTVLKMACKRAQVAMTLNATAASDIFTQDIEDLPEELQREIEGRGEGGATAPEPKGYKKPSPKGGAAAKPSPAGASTAAHATGPATSGEVQVEYATEGMIAHFTKKIEAAGSTWGKELVHAGLAPGVKLTKAQCQAMLNHAQQPSGDPRKPTVAELDLGGHA